MREKLKQLESVARQLDPPAALRREMLAEVARYAESFLESLPGAGTYVSDRGQSRELRSGMQDAPSSLADLLAELARAVDTPGINPASGGHLGYVPGGGVYPSALGDFLADVFNRFSGVAFASPGAARMERDLVNWMATLVGYPAEAGGDLTSGGSIANLTALVTAREAKALRSRDIPDCTIYLTRQAHHCIEKALRVAGLEECRRRIVPMDGHFRMDSAALASMIHDDRAEGLRPWLVAASAGTTDTGAVDPVADIAAIARREDLWLHLDAAYGGFFLLCEEGRQALGDLSGADSIVMDPHKGLFLPYGSGALLVRDVHQLARAHSFEANYMLDARENNPEYSPADLSPELSRPFRGLRLWLPLKVFGLNPFRAALAEKIALARYFHQRISAMPGFEAGPEPDLSVVTYRYLPARGDADEFNRRLLRAVLDDGRIFLSSTRLDGRFTLRLAVLHFRTHLETIDEALDLLRHHADKLEADGERGRRARR